MQDGQLYYLVEPARAIEIEQMVGRYNSAGNRRIWKLGTDLTVDDITRALGAGTGPADLESLESGGVESFGE